MGYCVVIGCKSSKLSLRKWRMRTCNKHGGVPRSDVTCTCPDPFTLLPFPSVLRNPALRLLWQQCINRKTELELADGTKTLTLYEPKENDRVCSLHFAEVKDGKATGSTPYPTLNIPTGPPHIGPKKRAQRKRGKTGQEQCGFFMEEVTDSDEDCDSDGSIEGVQSLKNENTGTSVNDDAVSIEIVYEDGSVERVSDEKKDTSANKDTVPSDIAETICGEVLSESKDICHSRDSDKLSDQTEQGTDPATEGVNAINSEPGTSDGDGVSLKRVSDIKDAVIETDKPTETISHVDATETTQPSSNTENGDPTEPNIDNTAPSEPLDSEHTDHIHQANTEHGDVGIDTTVEPYRDNTPVVVDQVSFCDLRDHLTGVYQSDEQFEQSVQNLQSLAHNTNFGMLDLSYEVTKNFDSSVEINPDNQLGDGDIEIKTEQCESDTIELPGSDMNKPSSGINIPLSSDMTGPCSSINEPPEHSFNIMNDPSSPPPKKEGRHSKRLQKKPGKSWAFLASRKAEQERRAAESRLLETNVDKKEKRAYGQSQMDTIQLDHATDYDQTEQPTLHSLLTEENLDIPLTAANHSCTPLLPDKIESIEPPYSHSPIKRWEVQGSHIDQIDESHPSSLDLKNDIIIPALIIPKSEPTSPSRMADDDANMTSQMDNFDDDVAMTSLNSDWVNSRVYSVYDMEEQGDGTNMEFMAPPLDLHNYAAPIPTFVVEQNNDMQQEKSKAQIAADISTQLKARLKNKRKATEKELAYRKRMKTYKNYLKRCRTNSVSTAAAKKRKKATIEPVKPAAKKSTTKGTQKSYIHVKPRANQKPEKRFTPAVSLDPRLTHRIYDLPTGMNISKKTYHVQQNMFMRDSWDSYTPRGRKPKPKPLAPTLSKTDTPMATLTNDSKLPKNAKIEFTIKKGSDNLSYIQGTMVFNGKTYHNMGVSAGSVDTISSAQVALGDVWRSAEGDIVDIVKLVEDQTKSGQADTTSDGKAAKADSVASDAVPSTSHAEPSNSHAVPRTSHAVTSTSHAEPSTSNAVSPSTSNAVPSTSSHTVSNQVAKPTEGDSDTDSANEQEVAPPRSVPISARNPSMVSLLKSARVNEATNESDVRGTSGSVSLLKNKPATTETERAVASLAGGSTSVSLLKKPAATETERAVASLMSATNESSAENDKPITSAASNSNIMASSNEKPTSEGQTDTQSRDSEKPGKGGYWKSLSGTEKRAFIRPPLKKGFIRKDRWRSIYDRPDDDLYLIDSHENFGSVDSAFHAQELSAQKSKMARKTNRNLLDSLPSYPQRGNDMTIPLPPSDDTSPFEPSLFVAGTMQVNGKPYVNLGVKSNTPGASITTDMIADALKKPSVTSTLADTQQKQFQNVVNQRPDLEHQGIDDATRKLGACYNVPKNKSKSVLLVFQTTADDVEISSLLNKSGDKSGYTDNPTRYSAETTPVQFMKNIMAPSLKQGFSALLSKGYPQEELPSRDGVSIVRKSGHSDNGRTDPPSSQRVGPLKSEVNSVKKLHILESDRQTIVTNVPNFIKGWGQAVLSKTMKVSKLTEKHAEPGVFTEEVACYADPNAEKPATQSKQSMMFGDTTGLPEHALKRISDFCPETPFEPSKFERNHNKDTNNLHQNNNLPGALNPSRSAAIAQRLLDNNSVSGGPSSVGNSSDSVGKSSNFCAKCIDKSVELFDLAEKVETLNRDLAFSVQEAKTLKYRLSRAHNYNMKLKRIVDSGRSENTKAKAQQLEQDMDIDWSIPGDPNDTKNPRRIPTPPLLSDDTQNTDTPQMLANNAGDVNKNNELRRGPRGEDPDWIPSQDDSKRLKGNKQQNRNSGFNKLNNTKRKNPSPPPLPDPFSTTTNASQGKRTKQKRPTKHIADKEKKTTTKPPIDTLYAMDGKLYTLNKQGAMVPFEGSIISEQASTVSTPKAKGSRTHSQSTHKQSTTKQSTKTLGTSGGYASQPYTASATSYSTGVSNENRISTGTSLKGGDAFESMYASEYDETVDTINDINKVNSLFAAKPTSKRSLLSKKPTKNRNQAQNYSTATTAQGYASLTAETAPLQSNSSAYSSSQEPGYYAYSQQIPQVNIDQQPGSSSYTNHYASGVSRSATTPVGSSSILNNSSAQSVQYSGEPIEQVEYSQERSETVYVSTGGKIVRSFGKRKIANTPGYANTQNTAQQNYYMI